MLHIESKVRKKLKMGLTIFGKGKGLAKNAVAKVVKEELTPAKHRAEELVKNTGDTLLGVKNDIAVIQGRAPYNPNILTTTFYDVSTLSPVWLKTKSVSNGKLDYLPFGIDSYQHTLPQNANKALQRKDVFPQQIGGFDSRSNFVTRIFDKWGNLIEKTNVSKRFSKEAGEAYSSRLVREETNNLSTQSRNIYIDPIMKPNNGSIRGYISENLKDGKNTIIHWA